jgi:2-polyprenyl-3-methyl-5-hydroxy-6-metoxy-1,4-benzoquinol methylase
VVEVRGNGLALEHCPEDRRLVARVRRRAQVILYSLLTGYRHTGERVHPFFGGNNYINHLRVYQFISQFVDNKEVLDVGCGVGYGTALLSRTASSAVGIDISLEAIREAYRFHSECKFFQMNAEELEFADERFDVVVSTENFEHLPHQSKHLAELARVTRKTGMCFIATPNPELSVGSSNPFHVKENTISELKDLLSSHFRQVEIVEPTMLPTNPEGRAARDERFAKGMHGKLVNPSLEIFGKSVNQTFLSNTHSFNCFVRDPIV